MRIRALFVAAASAALVPVLAPAALAGTSYSTWCSDGAIGSGREIPILTSPITVGAEVLNSPTDLTHQTISICFSDTPVGTPSNVSGGIIQLIVDTNTSTATPSAFVTLGCAPDGGTFLGCNNATGAAATPGDLGISTPPSSTCLVSINTGCVATVPGVKVATDQDRTPLLVIDLVGLSEPVNAPVQCIAVVVNCP